MAAHPDGSNHVFLANIHEMLIDESNPFLDIADIVHVESELGLLSIAFHPKFPQNGRYFASYNCDNVKSIGCYGRCSCNTDVNCDPSKLSPRNGTKPCQYHSVILEFTANGSSLSDPALVIRANPTEVRRIFTMGLAYTTFHGGQILFGPDGYLYIKTMDNEARTDPHNFAQNKKSLLGKILRFDIDKIPKTSKFQQWGTYSIPSDNPYYDDKELLPEIWSLGLGNPWRCSFDSERPSYFLCGDCGQDKYEEVNLITKGENYGWRDYESSKTITPEMGYAHSSVNPYEGSAAITGGYFYCSKTDPCMYGKKFNVAYLFSMGTDNNKDVFLLTNNGILRVVRPSRCNHTCSLENITDFGNSHPVHPSRSSCRVPQTKLLILFSSLVLLLVNDLRIIC
ncbi:hypothetical protein MKX01_016701 [Papaver californicum]|nr:hypothetical protein MKX01_016701 [Papaver californicum]